MSLESRLGKVPVAALPSATYLCLAKGTSVREAVARMRDQQFEVVLVMDATHPSAILTPERVRQQILGSPDQWDKPVEELAEPIRSSSPSLPLGELLKALQSQPYLVLMEGDQIHAVLTQGGLLRFLSSRLNFQFFNQTPETERAVRAREQVHT